MQIINIILHKHLEALSSYVHNLLFSAEFDGNILFLF